MRTHEAMRIKTAGANETSAMKSAESEVKNYGYQSTFPLLINIKGNPVYLMSLKDNGLIKMYATVSATDYQKVATVYSDEGLDALVKKTLNVLGTSDEISEADDGNAYKIAFSTKYENQLAFLKAGDTLKIRYIDADGVKTIKSIEEEKSVK